MSSSEYFAELTGQIADSYAQKLDRHIEAFLKKNLVPFDGDMAKANQALEAKGMMLISEIDHSNVFGDRATTYMLVKIIDKMTVTIESPTISPTKGGTNE